MTSGEVIRRIRESIGMTQAGFGALLYATPPAVSLLEHDDPGIRDRKPLDVSFLLALRGRRDRDRPVYVESCTGVSCTDP
jgi:hypothetical protein